MADHWNHVFMALVFFAGLGVIAVLGIILIVWVLERWF